MSETTRSTRPGRAAGDHTVFLKDPVQETLFSMVMALTGELSVVRERLDAHERLLSAEGLPVTPDDVDGYTPDGDARTYRQAVRKRILAHVMRSVNERLLPGELLEQNQSYADIMADVQRDSAE
jgi:hypothetical protein